MRGSINPLPQYAFLAWCLIKAQVQLYFYLHRNRYVIRLFLWLHYLATSLYFRFCSHSALKFCIQSYLLSPFCRLV